jgi:thioredoxin 1
MSVPELTAEQLDDWLAQGRLTLVKFWAEWCGPCRTLSPVLDELSQQFAGQVDFAQINTDERPELALRFQVQSVPTILLFDGGIEVARLGAAPKRQLAQAIEEHLAA